jgi:predicted ABC-type ATPase
MTGELWLWLLAGSNGAGKSTYAPNLPVEVIINPDDIAREFKPDAPEKAALTAGREAMRRMRELIAQRRSFAVETTLSGRQHVKIVTDAKAAGWKIGLVYVGLSNAEVAIGRIRERKMTGGHDVPPPDVRRRFERSLQNLTVVYVLADRVMIFDNSSTRRKMRKILEANRGRVIFRASRLPTWVKRSLGAIIGSRSGRS